LTAVTSWDRSALRDRERYQVRITLPDGRVETQTLGRDNGPGAPVLHVFVPRDSVRNLLPGAVRVLVQLVDAFTGASASNPLVATIDQFPTPRFVAVDKRPFGWGKPLTPDDSGVVELPGPGPDGLEFVRVPAVNGQPAFYISRYEVSNRQVKAKLQGEYDPSAGRSDNFALEADDQPALNLSPALAQKYLEALSADGLNYRLPTREEWLRAARGGRTAGFWWDDAEVPKDAANFLGPEPGLLEGDTTAPVRPSSGPAFRMNSFGLAHVFGNVAEWATTNQPGIFARMGGHFRTDTQGGNFMAEVFESTVTGADALGDANDPGRPYVGLRPVLELDAASGRGAMLDALANAPELADVEVDFDPDRSIAKINGKAPDARARRLADRRLRSLWFLSAVEDQVQTPAAETGRLATLGEVTGPAVRSATALTRWTDFVKVATRWADELPVSGSTWFTNVFLPNGSVISQVLPEITPGPDGRATILVPVGELRAQGLPDGGPVTIGLSLGAPATSTADPHIVSNLDSIKWIPANPIPGTPKD
jgi:formylglycine-generating enzyme required for sulfatase activity